MAQSKKPAKHKAPAGANVPVPGHQALHDELEFALGDYARERESEIAALLPKAPSRDAAAKLIWLRVAMTRDMPIVPAVSRGERERRIKRLRSASHQVSALRAAILACEQDLKRRTRTRSLPDGAWGSEADVYTESISHLDYIAYFLQMAESEVPPDRDEAWHMATAFRDILKRSDILVGKTVSGTWARCIKYALPFVCPQSDVEDKLASLKRQWDRDRAPLRDRKRQ